MHTAIVYILSACKKSPASVKIRLHVKPGVSKIQEGVRCISDTVVALNVAAQARDGEANKAVIRILSDILKIPKSDLTLAHGVKSRDKVLIVKDVQNHGEDYASTVLDLLTRASNR